MSSSRLARVGPRLRRVASLLVRSLRRRRGPYPISISAAHSYRHAAQPVEGVETFDTEAASRLNRARMQHLDSLGLPLAGRTVVDVGCGVGHLAQFFAAKGCDVLCLDARSENIERLQQLYPGCKADVLDLERGALAALGPFDVVFAYGLLYHLENPYLAIQKLASASRGLVILETIVADHELPLVRMDEETATFSQAVQGVGCRPTPSFVALALREAGIPHVYAPRIVPDHEDFRFEWRNDLGWARDGHPLRCMFVGSREPLGNPNLVEVWEDAS